jgi:hypothetical protein
MVTVERKHTAARDPTHRARARNNGDHVQVRLDTTNTQPELDGEKGGKDGELTVRSPACLGKSEEDRSGRISPETVEEEVDVVVAVVVPGSIP